jgi:nicotinate-nucleotide adenylyltransferase
MRIAFFGGTFDPPHLGHIAIAEAARDRCELDLVLMAPVGTQPLKQDAKTASFADRLAMVRLACEGHPGLRASELDAPLQNNREDAASTPNYTPNYTPYYTPNYTYDTLLRLRSELAPADELFCLLGADSFRMVQRWHRGPELLLLCDYIIAARPGFPITQLTEYLPSSIACEGPCVTARRTEWLLRDGVSGSTSKLWVLPDLDYDISATAVRAALDCTSLDCTSLDCRSLACTPTGASQQVLAPAVARYACEHGLYQRG